MVAGLPDDPTLRILALRRPHDAQELYGRDGLVQRLGDDTSEARGDLDGALFALTQQLDEHQRGERGALDRIQHRPQLVGGAEAQIDAL